MVSDFDRRLWGKEFQAGSNDLQNFQMVLIFGIELLFAMIKPTQGSGIQAMTGFPGEVLPYKPLGFKVCVMVILVVLAFFSVERSLSVTVDPISPASGVQWLTSPPEIKTWVRGLSGSNATVRFYRRESPPAVWPDFTIAVLPDTQFYTGTYPGHPPNNPAIFNSQTDWIVANREARNIAFTIQLGDLVLLGETVEAEWLAAANAMSRLENPLTTKLQHGMPYSICVADHDGSGEYLAYNRHFGISRFAGRSYYGGHLGTNNNNHYSIFSASGMDFIVVSLEIYAGSKPAVMNWANAVLGANGNRRAIIMSHSLLYPGGNWNPSGKAIYDALKGNPNVFLMLCGHDPQIGMRTDTFNDNRITTVLSDYSNEPNGGNGWMRIMRFAPSRNKIEVQTYSPWLDQFKSTIYHQFELPYKMIIPDPPFTLMNTLNVSADGVVNGGRWNDLVPSTSYDWYATIEQGGVVAKSEIWSFSTAFAYSSISYPSYPVGSPFSEPFAIASIRWNGAGFPVIRWNSVGGRRYRVEFSNGSGGISFRPIIRSLAEETDPAPVGLASYMEFVDDGSLTGGPSGFKFYRIRQMAPVLPLQIIKISKPEIGHPAIMWNSLGGRRYRVEVSDGGPGGFVFREVVRSPAEETDAAEEGAASYQIFVDDGTLTGTLSSSRFYRVREMP